MLKLFYPVSLLIFVVVFLSSCATTKNTVGRPIYESKVNQIVKGKTTTLQIVEMFGAPTETSTLGEQELYIYKYCVTSGSGFYTGYFGQTKTEEKCDELTVTFDKESGTVVAYNFEKRTQ